MHGSLRCGFLALLFALAFPANGDERLRPTFVSEVIPPDEKIVLPLLKAVCGEGVRTVTPQGQKAIGCGDDINEILTSRHRERRYSWMPYVVWQADGLIFGHFLSPMSEDAAINCYACDGHAALYGGTLLLTKKSGQWEPVWYKSGIITRHCRRVPLPTGREILFCEENDGGMGHSIHGLYLIDFTNPKFAWRNVVLMADSYASEALGGVQAQSIDRVVFEKMEERGLLVRVYAQHGRIDLRPDDRFDEQALPTPKLSAYEIDFRLAGETFNVASETAAAARLFRTDLHQTSR